MTKKMLNALNVLEKSKLTWEKSETGYLWITEEKKPSNIFTRTLQALEREKLITLTCYKGRMNSLAEITQLGKDELSKMRTLPKDNDRDTEITEQKWTEITDSRDKTADTEDAKESNTGDKPEEPACGVPKEQIIFLVDSENVGNTWFDLLDNLQEDDELHIFYTDKSPTITYQTVVDLMKHEKIKNLVWEKCCVGNNALDFQLATALGGMVAEKKIHGKYDPSYIIMSKDNGYDAIVYYWSSKDVKIRRFASINEIEYQLKQVKETETSASPNFPKEPEPPAPTEKKSKNVNIRHQPMQTLEDCMRDAGFISVKKENNNIKNVLRGDKGMEAINTMLKAKTWREKLVDFLSEKTSIEKPKEAAEYLIEMSKLVSITNEGKYLYAVIAQFGGLNGKIIMDEIHKDRFLKINLSNGLIKNIRTRRKDYIMLFMRNNGFLDPDIRSITPLMSKPSDIPRKEVERLLLRNHSMEETTKLLNIIDTHTRVLKEMC